MNVYLASAFLLLCATVLSDSTQRRDREHYIDLLTVTSVEAPDPVPATKRLTLQQPVDATPHHGRPEPDLVVLAPQLDRTVYNWGDPFVFEWVIENQGKQPVKFPTLTADDRVSREMPGARLAAIGLRFVDENLAGEIVGMQALYGADSVPGSLLVVQPGERVRIRARGKWSLTGLAIAGVGSARRTHQVTAIIQMVRRGATDLSGASDAVLSVSIGK